MTLNSTSMPYSTRREHESPVPSTSMLPGSEIEPPPAVSLLNRTVRGAHKAIDQLADGAEPHVQRLSEQAAMAEQSLQAKKDQLRQTCQAWTESVRSGVRGQPLTSVALAVGLGVLLARMSLRTRRMQ